MAKKSPAKSASGKSAKASAVKAKAGSKAPKAATKAPAKAAKASAKTEKKPETLVSKIASIFSGKGTSEAPEAPAAKETKVEKAAPAKTAQEPAVKKEKKEKKEKKTAEVKTVGGITDNASPENKKKWHDLKDKLGKEKAAPYSMAGQFEANQAIEHKVLGWGYIVSNNNDRLEVLFETGVKILISNYKN